MRAPQDLLDLPYTFVQQPLLTANGFRRVAQERGVQVTEAQLEGLHRVGLVTPLLRIRRDGRAIARLARSDPLAAQHLAEVEPTSRLDVLEAREHGRLFDPAREHFVARRRLRRSARGIEYRSSEYLYSLHQLLVLEVVKSGLPFLRYRPQPPPEVTGIDVTAWWLKYARSRARWLADVVVAVSTLEPIYYPKIVQQLSLPSVEEFDRYDDWRRRLPLTRMRDWLNVEASWLKETALALLDIADGFDPLGDWFDLIREADPDRWKRLKGQARGAMDFRIAAEILLRYYDDLARGRRAKPLDQPRERWRSPFAGRLKRQGDIDSLLTSFGLSPHPSLVLVVEGGTEVQIFPRLMDYFHIRRDEDFIALQDAEGVDTNLAPLLAYAVAPRTQLVEHGRYLRLQRPLTRALFVIDAEGAMRTPGQREKRRRVWVERLVRALPTGHRTTAVAASLDDLVSVDTWGRGLSFEFAHFTDRQLARAIASLDRRSRQPQLSDRIQQLATIRSRRGNIEGATGPISKVDLAEALWPVLEEKIRRAERRRTDARIPIVRVLDRAIALAQQTPRRNIVIER